MREMPELKITMAKVSELVPYANNAKLHPFEQVDQIAASIEEFGNNDPIAVWHNADGEMEIVEGHGRLMALNKLGIEEAPIITRDHLTDEQRKAYALVHNKLTMNSDFDVTILIEELESITSIDMEDFDFAIGDIDFIDFDEAQRIDSSKRLSSRYVSVVIGAAKFEIDDETHELYDATREIDVEKASEFLTDALMQGLMK